MAIRYVKMLILTLAAGLTGCATMSAPATPDFRDRDLRPMNQDLAAWLERMNAVPGEGTSPVAAVPAVVSATPLPPTPPVPQLASSTSAPSIPTPPSPRAGVPKPATATPPPVPVVAANAAGTPSFPIASLAGVPLPGQEPGQSGPGAPAGRDTLAATSPAPAPVAPKPDPWLARTGATLRSTVETWGKRSGWTVVWNAAIDYPIVGELRYEDDFVAAIQGVFRAHATAERPLRAVLNPRHHLLTVEE